jgi:hypothetical protein
VVSIDTGLYYIYHIHNLMTGNPFLDSEKALDIANALNLHCKWVNIELYTRIGARALDLTTYA